MSIDVVIAHAKHWLPEDIALLRANETRFFTRLDRRRDEPIRMQAALNYVRGFSRIDKLMRDLNLCDAALTPARRVSPNAIRGVIACLLEEDAAPKSIKGLLDCYKRVLVSIDTVPPIELRFIDHLRRDLVSFPPRDDFEGPAWSEVTEAAEAELDEAGNEEPCLASARRFRTALQLLIISEVALRVKNLWRLREGDDATLVWRDGFAFTVFEPDETKNWRTIDVPLSKKAAGYLKRYIDDFRPILCAGSYRRDGSPEQQPYTGNLLWVTRRGGPQTISSIYRCIVELTKKRLKQPISPHKLRHIIATSIAKDSPDEASKAARKLCDCEGVTRGKYQRGGMREAVRALNAKRDVFFD